MKNECAQPFLSHVPSFSAQGKPASGAICSPKLIVTLLLATLLSGCVLSFYPLFDSGQALYDPDLVGVWKAINADPGKPEKTKMIFTVTRLSDRNSYWLETEMDHQPKGLYYAEIGLVGTNRFLQIAPRRPPDIPARSIYGGHFIEAWSFWKMRLDGNKLELADMNYEWLEAMVKAGKVDIKHEQQDRRFIVLTASTRDLQSFVTKYANEAFGEGIEFDRQKAAQPGGAAPAPSRPLTPVLAGSPQDITNIIHYTPPTDFWGGAARGTRSDPGDNPLSLDGPELLHYVYPNRGDVIFKIGLAGAYLGKGKIVKFLSTEPSDLQKYMEAEYQGRFPLVTVTPAVIGIVSGLTAVSMDGTRPPGPVKPTFLHFCWVQIDTNIVLKITAVANSAKDFQQETNSLTHIPHLGSVIFHGPLGKRSH